MQKFKEKVLKWLKWSEKYTKTDMVYLVKNSFWVNANTVILSILAFILSIVFARFLSKEIYGTYQFLISISSIIGALTLTGMNSAVIQAVARGYEGVFQKSIKEQIEFIYIPVVVGLGISTYYLIGQNITLSASMLIIAVLLPLSNVFNTWTAFVSGKKDFKSLFLYSQIINFTYYLGIIATIIFFPNAIILIFVNFFINTITNLFIYKKITKKYNPNENQEEEAISFGKKFSLSNIIPMIALNIDNIAVFHFLGAQDLAIYAFASNIPERLGGLLRPISTIAFPKFSERDPKEIIKTLPTKTLQLFIISLVGGVIYFIISPFIFKIFFPQYLGSVFYSQIYAIAIVIGTAGNLLFTALASTRSNNIFKFNTINPIFNIVVVSTTVYFFGIWGAIIGKIISNIFYLVISNYYLQNEFQK